jgi:shikimate kinase
MIVKKNLVLLGMMAVGKSTLAKIVAKKQKLDFVDIDKNVEKKNLMKIKEIFNQKGEAFFRSEEEKEVLKSLKKNNCVIALGGGAFINKTIRENVLKNSLSIWLDINIKKLNERVKWNSKRPLLKKDNNEKFLQKIYDERKKIYKLANHKIICDRLSKEKLVKKIIEIYDKQ